MSGDLPNLRHLRLLLACVRLGSVTRAADAVGVSQPAASQALGRLERLYNARLLDRQQAPLKATADGDLVLRRARRAFELMRAGCARLPRQRAGGAEALAARLTSAHLRVLSALAEGGSFNAAARLLGHSEPAVHRTGREAEIVLATRLFEGRGQTVRLSAAGLSAARWARLALNELINAAIDLRDAQGRHEGRIAVGTLPLTRTMVVPNALAAVTARWPDARFEIVEGRYDAQLQDLEMGRIDVIVGALREGFASRTLQQEALFTYRLAVVARAGHPLAGKAEVTIADLADYPWIVARAATPSRRIFGALSARFPPDRPARVTVETGSLVTIRGLMLRTDHLALLSRHQIHYEMEAGFLAPLAFDLPDALGSVGLTTRKYWLPTAVQAAFIDALRAEARAYA